HWSRAEFDSRAPGMDWGEYLGAAGLGGQPVFVVWQPGAVTGISALVREVPLETWKEHLALRELERSGDYLTKAFVEERFDFFSKGLSGIPVLRERWKRAV